MFDRRRDWLWHMRNSHPIASHDSPAPCSLCGQSQHSQRRLNPHLAKHLEEVSLFAMRSGDEDDLQVEDEDTSHDEDTSGDSDDARRGFPLEGHGDNDGAPDDPQKEERR